MSRTSLNRPLSLCARIHFSLGRSSFTRATLPSVRSSPILGRRPRLAPQISALFIFALLSSVTTSAQLAEIDRAKLPQDQRTQAAYSNLASVEPLARNWSPDWTSSIPKPQVVSTVSASVADFRAVQSSAPDNAELLLATGLAAHYAYNLDVETDYEIAEQSLKRAGQLSPTDFRADWFLGMHYCQATEQKKGMEMLLAIEDKTPAGKLPVDFWDDYITCALVSNLPAHTLRAINRAESLGAPASKYASFAAIVQKRYTSTDVNSTYASRDVWRAEHNDNDIRFQSALCGVAFTARPDWRVDLADFTNGNCLATIEMGPYTGTTGKGTPSMLLLTRSPKPEEDLKGFVRSFLKKYPLAKEITAASCPATDCVEFEIVTDAIYKGGGGGHMLAIGFAAKPPEFPGLLFEQIDPPPSATTGEAGAYYRVSRVLTRLPGTLYTLVILDSNAQIFEPASADFQFLLKSIQLD